MSAVTPRLFSRFHHDSIMLNFGLLRNRYQVSRQELPQFNVISSKLSTYEVPRVRLSLCKALSIYLEAEGAFERLALFFRDSESPCATA